MNSSTTLLLSMQSPRLFPVLHQQDVGTPHRTLMMGTIKEKIIAPTKPEIGQ